MSFTFIPDLQVWWSAKRAETITIENDTVKRVDSLAESGRDVQVENPGLDGTSELVSAAEFGGQNIIRSPGGWQSYFTSRNNANHFNLGPPVGLLRSQPGFALYALLRPSGGSPYVLTVNGTDNANGNARLILRVSGGNFVLETNRVDSESTSSATLGPRGVADVVLVHAYADWENGVCGGALNGGQPSAVATTSSGLSQDDDPRRLTLGYSASHFGTIFAGDHADYRIGHGVPTNEQRQQAEGAILHDWGFQHLLPANHPYRNDPPWPTPESTWKASFTDASGNPPFESSLLATADAQRLADHNASLWIGKPGEWKARPKWIRLTAQEIGYGDMAKIRPGSVIWVKKNVPALKNGRWVKVMGVGSDTVRAGPVRLLCMLWEPDS